MPDLTQEGLAARGLRVRKLVWQDTEIPAYGVLHAKTTFGTYFIERDGTGRFLVQHDHAGVGSYSTLEAARAAAQADYAARILAALEDTGEPALIREAEARGMERAAETIDQMADAIDALIDEIEIFRGMKQSPSRKLMAMAEAVRDRLFRRAGHIPGNARAEAARIRAAAAALRKDEEPK